MRARMIPATLAAVLALAASGPSHADPIGGAPHGSSGPSSSAFQPLVPVSAFARPAAWFDRSRLNVSTTVSVGTGWGGGTDALQVTSLSYQVAAPLAVRLSVGNAFGGNTAGRANGMFLEGFAVSYRPHPSFQIHVDYRDVRSPLQLSHTPGFGGIGR